MHKATVYFNSFFANIKKILDKATNVCYDKHINKCWNVTAMAGLTNSVQQEAFCFASSVIELAFFSGRGGCDLYDTKGHQ